MRGLRIGWRHAISLEDYHKFHKLLVFTAHCLHFQFFASFSQLHVYKAPRLFFIARILDKPSLTSNLTFGSEPLAWSQFYSNTILNLSISHNARYVKHLMKHKL